MNDYTQGDRVEGMGKWVSGDVNDYTQGDQVEGMGEWVSGHVNDYSQGDRVEGMGEWGCDAETLEPLAYTTPRIQLNVATLYKTKLLSPGRSLRAGGRGFPPATMTNVMTMTMAPGSFYWKIKEIWNQKTSLAVRFPTYMYCCIYRTT